MYKCSKDPRYIEGHLKRRGRSGARACIMAILPKNDCFRKSTFWEGEILWRSLPHEIKNAGNTDIFKKMIQLYVELEIEWDKEVYPWLSYLSALCSFYSKRRMILLKFDRGYLNSLSCVEWCFLLHRSKWSFYENLLLLYFQLINWMYWSNCYLHLLL